MSDVRKTLESEISRVSKMRDFADRCINRAKEALGADTMAMLLAIDLLNDFESGTPGYDDPPRKATEPKTTTER